MQPGQRGPHIQKETHAWVLTLCVHHREVLNRASLCFFGEFRWDSGAYAESLEAKLLLLLAFLLPPYFPVLICSGCFNKIPQTGWLKQPESVLSQFWRTEVQSQVGLRVSSLCSTPLFWCLVGLWGSFGVFWLVDTSPRPLPSSSHGALPVSKFPLFTRIQSYWLRAHPIPA